MQYRVDPRGGRVSALGLGCMRFPGFAVGRPDPRAAREIVSRAVERGVNYLDTAYLYPGNEEVVGRVLSELGVRDRVLVATKLPHASCRSPRDFDRYLDEQLRRLRTDRVDYYLMHNITSPGQWERLVGLGIEGWIERQRASGRIGRIGFSFHGSSVDFPVLLDAYDWDFCQIQLNFMDKNHQAGVKGLKAAAERGLGVVIMEPLKGGRITDAVPPTVQKIWDEAPIKRTPAEWAFKWLANMPEVTVMLSGMNAESQLQENMKTLSDEHVADLTQEEKDLIDRVSDEYNRLIKYSCTGCNYCMPCPQKLDIPRILRYFNDWNIYEQNPSTKLEYETWIPAGRHASDCIGCKACEEKCPQHLPISQAMKEAAEAMGV